MPTTTTIITMRIIIIMVWIFPIPFFQTVKNNTVDHMLLLLLLLSAHVQLHNARNSSSYISIALSLLPLLFIVIEARRSIDRSFFSPSICHYCIFVGLFCSTTFPLRIMSVNHRLSIVSRRYDRFFSTDNRVVTLMVWRILFVPRVHIAETRLTDKQ